MVNLVFKKFLCGVVTIVFLSTGMAWPGTEMLSIYASSIRPLANMESKSRNPVDASSDFAKQWGGVVNEMIEAAGQKGENGGGVVLEALYHMLLRDGTPVNRHYAAGIARVLDVLRNRKIYDPENPKKVNFTTKLVEIAMNRAYERLYAALDELPLLTASPRPSDI